MKPLENIGLQTKNNAEGYSERALKVVRQMYMLLMMSVAAISALTVGIVNSELPAWVNENVGMWGAIAFFVGIVISLIIANKQADTSSALIWYGIFVGFMGVDVALIIHPYVATGQLGAVLNAALATFVIFAGLSMYAHSTRTNFKFLGAFLFTGLIALIVISLANIFWIQSGALNTTISVIGALLFTGFILYDTSRVLNEDETNYVRASISMLLNLINLFLFLLRLFSGRPSE
jgi:modulator of FtsH protease